MLRRHQLAVAIVASFALLVFGASHALADSFDDVPPGFWAYAVIGHITTLGIMDSCGTGFFCPSELVTREDMAIWLERVEHYDGSVYEPPSAQGIFEDVPAQSCVSDWIEQLYHDGITKGCHTDPLLYCPRKIMSRAEMAVFLVRVQRGVGFTPAPCNGHFDDVPCPGGKWPPADYIEQLWHDGVTAGCSADPPLFCPYGSVTRAQMAAFLTGVLSNMYCKVPGHSETCWNPSAPETGPDVVAVTLDGNDDGHELIGE